MSGLTLAEYLDGREPFGWGGRDCLLWPADWCLRAAGVDPASEYRGRYHTCLGALRLINREGGLLALADRSMASAGFQRTATPVAGDVGVVLALTERGPAPVGAIFNGRLWVALTARGQAAAEFHCLKAWRVCCPR